MKSSEIRDKYLKFFESKGHQVLPGSSLVPKDPTVLLTLAGMLQFKPIFLGMEKPEHKRAATVQRCMRMNDIVNVGQTPRHHTFFEMLGNFSFGDYFKKEAIQFAWELIAKEFAIPVTKLRIAVFEKDDEAYEIWRQDIGLPKEIIYRLGEDNNFWAAGPTGPCGPCSEIYYDLGEEKGCGKADCSPGCDCDRFLEIWNLVFIQFNRNEKGELLPLKQKGIDTGMGLERITAVLQGVGDNFETDLFVPLIDKIRGYAKTPNGVSLRIIADHSRSITNLIADGVFPSNTGRGYVLRRLVRRVVSHGRKCGIERPFLDEVALEVIAMMGDVYPHLKEKQQIIKAVIKEEEASFLTTLDKGLELFTEIIGRFAKEKMIPGLEAFKLHDTFGFPIELTVELAAEKGCQVEMNEYEAEMAKQRERARQSGIEGGKKNLLFGLELGQVKPTQFTGYEKQSEESKVAAIFPEQKLVILEKSPFYGQSGGQVGDTGLITAGDREYLVMNTLLAPPGIILHEVDKLDGLTVNAKVRATIDSAKRKATEAHHTATHLLHKALREVLGEHVKQAGSYVGPDKLRFDFSHFHAMSEEEINRVEELVNQQVKSKLKVEVLNKSYKDALKLGAMALFGEKYGDQVRVLKIGEYSIELCGGTHVKSTSDIGYFKIAVEGALGSGVRRIEAFAGQAAKVAIIFKAKSIFDAVSQLIEKYKLLRNEKSKLCVGQVTEANIFEIEVTEVDRLAKAIDTLDTKAVNNYLEHLYGRLDWLKERLAKEEKEIEQLRLQCASGLADSLLAEIKEVHGKKVLLKEVAGLGMEELRSLADTINQKAQPQVLALASNQTNRVSFLILAENAKQLADAFGREVVGKGGGKGNKVEGGGKDPTKIQAGLAAISQLI